MKNIVIAAIAATIVATTASAETPAYTFTPAHMMEPETSCSTTDVIIGAGATVAASIVVGVVAVATAPLITGGTVGYAAATSGAILTGSTLPAIASAPVVLAPTVGVAGYYASCVTRAVMGK
jgi:hypothetical protein